MWPDSPLFRGIQQRLIPQPKAGPTMDAWKARIPQDIDGVWPDSELRAMSEQQLADMAMDSATPMGVVGRTANVAGKTAKNIIGDWKWRDLASVRDELGLTELPQHVKDFGQFMRRQAERATRGELGVRDLAKGNLITQASIQRSATDADKLREAGLKLPEAITGKIRPEGAMAEWMFTPAGQEYLDGIERGVVKIDAVEDAVAGMKPFGKHNDLREKMILNRDVAQLGPRLNNPVTNAYIGNRGVARKQMQEIVDQIKGIGPAKKGFVGAMEGYGIDPVTDARQLILHTGRPTKEASPFLGRGGGRGAEAATARLAARQRNLGIDIPEELQPFDQYLMHHAVWDKAGNEVTTHSDLIKAMMTAGFAGALIPGVYSRIGASPQEKSATKRNTSM